MTNLQDALKFFKHIVESDIATINNEYYHSYHLYKAAKSYADLPRKIEDKKLTADDYEEYGEDVVIAVNSYINDILNMLKEG